MTSDVLKVISSWFQVIAWCLGTWILWQIASSATITDNHELIRVHVYECGKGDIQ